MNLKKSAERQTEKEEKELEQIADIVKASKEIVLEPLTDFMGNEILFHEPYLEKLGTARKITLLQFQKVLHPDVYVVIKPNNHKIYYSGSALYIPKDMYDWEVNDISLRKSYEEEEERNGSIALFVNENESYEKKADKEELEKINNYYLNNI